MTRRKEIIDILARELHSAESLARIFGTHPRVILRDLLHVEKSLKTAGKRLSVEMPFCRDCGFVFHIKEPRAPSKCPNCRSEWIEKPRFRVMDV